MIENWQLAEQLRWVKEFTLTEDHLKLLRHGWVHWDDGEGDGAPGIDCKKPYGNSYVAGDVAEILGASDEEWIWEDGHKSLVTSEAAAPFMRLHVETMVALQIVLATGEFRPGRYRRAAVWTVGWKRDESAP